MGVVLLLVTFLVLAALLYLLRRNRKERTA
jgi:putative spermidine/putrescine transport system permease protein